MSVANFIKKLKEVNLTETQLSPKIQKMVAEYNGLEQTRNEIIKLKDSGNAGPDVDTDLLEIEKDIEKADKQLVHKITLYAKNKPHYEALGAASKARHGGTNTNASTAQVTEPAPSEPVVETVETQQSTEPATEVPVSSDDSTIIPDSTTQPATAAAETESTTTTSDEPVLTPGENVEEPEKKKNSGAGILAIFGILIGAALGINYLKNR